MGFLAKLWWLLCAHALCDYVLQTERMADLKRPQGTRLNEYGPWWWWMTAHALINGLGVALVTQQLLLGVGETIVHFCLDTLKCRHALSPQQDQIGHLMSKILWALFPG